MTTAPFVISASALKLFELCPRSWYLKHVLRAPDDAAAGGKYLARGNEFDRLVQLHVRGEATGDPGASKLANRQLAAARRSLPAPGTAEVQFAYDVDAGGGLRVRGKPDLRKPAYDGVAWIGDTKTTSDRGPGQGAASDRPAYALTDETLAKDIQFRLYAWCELRLNLEVNTVAGTWTYVSKADCPKSWDVFAGISRAEVHGWFESYVRPTAEKMRALTESGLPADQVPANPDSCRRCFVRGACPGPFEGPNVFGLTGPQQTRGKGMAFDVKRLRGNPDRSEACAPPETDRGCDDLTARLEASVAAVQINRPVPATVAEYRALPEADAEFLAAVEAAQNHPTVVAGREMNRIMADADALEVTTIEGPGAAELIVQTVVAGPTLAERHQRLVTALEALLADAIALAADIKEGGS